MSMEVKNRFKKQKRMTKEELEKIIDKLSKGEDAGELSVIEVKELLNYIYEAQTILLSGSLTIVGTVKDFKPLIDKNKDECKDFMILTLSEYGNLNSNIDEYCVDVLIKSESLNKHKGFSLLRKDSDYSMSIKARVNRENNKDLGQVFLFSFD